MQANHLIYMPVHSHLAILCSKEFVDSKTDKYFQAWVYPPRHTADPYRKGGSALPQRLQEIY